MTEHNRTGQSKYGPGHHGPDHHAPDHGHDHHGVRNHDDDTSLLEQVALALESAEALDTAADAVRPWAQWLTAEPVRRAILQGAWLGHKLHPVLTDLPVGFLTSATVLDVLQGKKAARATETLIALGVLSAVPTALTGWADWGSAPRRAQRVGVVHAALNGGGVALYALSLLQRRRGRHGVGVALGLVASGAIGAGGFLGGHLAKPGD